LILDRPDDGNAILVASNCDVGVTRNGDGEGPSHLSLQSTALLERTEVPDPKRSIKGCGDGNPLVVADGKTADPAPVPDKGEDQRAVLASASHAPRPQPRVAHEGSSLAHEFPHTVAIVLPQSHQKLRGELVRTVPEGVSGESERGRHPLEFGGFRCVPEV